MAYNHLEKFIVIKRLNNLLSAVRVMIRGNSLAEFATVSALMATLAGTAAPALSSLVNTAKVNKSTNEMDKILVQAKNFYEATADVEGRGRLPGQDKFNRAVGGFGPAIGTTLVQQNAAQCCDEGSIFAQIDENGSFKSYDDENGSKWRSVFGTTNADAYRSGVLSEGHWSDDTYTACPTCKGTKPGHEEWLELFGYNTLSSPFQDGHFIYIVLAGGGTGEKAFPPILYVADVDNPAELHVPLAP